MYFLGQRLKYGGVGTDWVLRLFKRECGRFKDVRVHESVEVQGDVSRLESSLLHYSYATVDEYYAKADQYTSLAAQDLWSKGRRFSYLDVLRPLWELFVRIVVRGAWRDGKPGIKYAVLSARTAWLRSRKLRAIEKGQAG
jgi:hypothetical protein